MESVIASAQRNEQPLVYLVLLNWNGIEHLPACLASLHRQSYQNFKLLMVDNGSEDESLEFARGAFPDIEIIANRRNIGFARANNQGLYHAIENGARYVILLNNDTECDPNFIQGLVAVAESDSHIAACAPKILYFRTRDIINGIGTEVSMFGYGWDRGVGEKDEGQYDEVCDVFGVSGGAMLIRSDVVKKVGAFDPTYFIYFEDIDLSWRIRLWGYRIVAVPKAVVYHKFSATMGKMQLRKEFLSEKNRIRGVLKSFELRNLAKIVPRMLCFDLRKLKYWLIEEGDSYSIKRSLILLMAYLWNILYLPSLLKHRRSIMNGRKLGDLEMMKFITPVMGGCTAVIPHYSLVNRKLFEKLHEPPQEIIMGLTDERSLGAGWGNLFELGSREGQARRTSKRAYFYLPETGSKEASLVIHLIGAPSEDIGGAVEVNGFELGRFFVKVHGEAIVCFPLPSYLSPSSVLEGCIMSHQTWTPHDVYHNGDYRRLGISVKSLGIRLMEK